MSESSGAQDASTLFLRISVPAGAEYHAIVKELAAKLAAYLGGTDPDGLAAGDALERVASAVASADGAGKAEDTLFEFRQADDALLIRARVGDRAVDARCPLPSRT